MSTTHNERAAAALRFAAAGWPVFPCKPGSKEPATATGFKAATTDPEQITRWWTACPGLNVAVPTGAPGPDVLDVDVREGGSGFEALNVLRRSGMLTGARALIRTPSGGLHVHFSGTEQACGRLPRHYLDYKASGGYVLIPPSVVAGKPYVLLDHRSGAACLDWAAVRELLEPRAAARDPAPVRGNVDALAAWVSNLPEGNRNSGLFWAACRAVESGHGDELGALAEAAIRAGLPDDEAQRTVSSAARKAAYQ